MLKLWTILFSAALAVLPANSQAQYAGTLKPDLSQSWEADVSPPPPNDWIKNMPGGVAPRVPRDLPAYPFRVFYLIPSNRTAQPTAVARIQNYVLTLKNFYSEQMERNGFGPKTITFETEADGLTPMVHIIYGANTDSYYRAEPWGRVAAAAQNSGLPVWSPGQVWLGVFEAHVMNPDGSIVGEYNGGSSSGSGNDAGLGITNSNSLALAREDLITSSAYYNGIILPELGPYPMVYGVTSASYDGDEIGELASVRFGVLSHEFAHALGLPHDFRNDYNFVGNLLGNGFRGFRSRMLVNQFPDNETRLSYGDAMALNVSRYFNPGLTYTDNTKPVISASSSANVTIINGHMPIQFTAYDAGGLSGATLQLDGNTVEEMHLSGTNVSTSFTTVYYAKSGANSYILNVFDMQGNKQKVNLTMTANGIVNQAPVPFVLLNSTVDVDENVVVKLYLSSDSESVNSLLNVEIDWNGDGEFEQGPMPLTYGNYSNSYQTPGNRLFRVRLTDPEGASTVSAPIAIRVLGDGSTVDDWDLY